MLIAALPIILVFVFLELNAAKQAPEGQKINDGQRKIARGLGWAILVVLVALLISSIFTNNGHPHIREIAKFIGLAIHFIF